MDEDVPASFEAPPAPEPDRPPPETPPEIYTELLVAARRTYRALKDLLNAETQQVPTPLIQAAVNSLKKGEQELTALADRAAPDNYLYGHVVNVTLLSLHLGVFLKLPDEELMTLGIAAFLHDLGMIQHLPLAMKPEKLTEEELQRIRGHTEESRRMLVLFPELNGPRRDRVDRVLGQIHERAGGGGYPAQAEDVDLLAAVIGVCDVYESLTHPRAWRPRLVPHKAVRAMVEQQEKNFPIGLVQSLARSLTLYPPGSYVRLSSDETARVLHARPDAPTRPRVLVVADASGKALPRPRNEDLASQPRLYVKDALDETALNSTDQRLLLELRGQRWWIRGL